MTLIGNKKHTSLWLAVAILLASGCSTQKRKGEVSGFKKFYHTFTSKYNGYFNANELMEESVASLEASHQDNFNQILPVYTYVDVDNPKAVAADLDLAIEKVTRVATIHSVGDYVDDCYVLMGKAQYLKHDYETAQETFEYFEQEFNPKNPYGSNFKEKKKSSKQKKKEREIERKNKKKEQDEKKKEEREARDKERKAKEKAKKEEKKAKDEERKRKKKEKEEEQKRRKKEREQAKKDRKKNKGKRKKRQTREEREAAKKAEEAAKLAEEKAAADAEAEAKRLEAEAKKEAEEAAKLTAPVDESTGEPKPEEESEEEDTPKKKKEKEEEDDTAYSEGMLWLARTYIEREKYSKAEFILRKLNQSAIKKDVRREIAPAYAHLYIEQKEYDKAIPHLQEAINTANDGKLKARYAYIMAQLYQRNRDYANALSAFEQVKKHKGDFRMDFNADLSIAKNGLLSGKESESQAFSRINKMLGEDKYKEFRDQIYFTLGELAVAQNDEPKALENFRASVKNNLDNAPLRAEAYYQIANLNFTNEDYVDAKYYFDSTLIHMPKQDERHIQVTKYATNLRSIAKYIETIEREDSLLRIADMDEDAKRKIAEQIIKEEKKNKAIADANASSGNGKDAKGMITDRKGNRGRARSLGSSKFFAYNTKSKEKALKDFKKQWGDRVLEDNWRRSSTQSFISEEETAEEEVVFEISDAEMNRALKDVPKNPAQVKEAHDKIAEAMYKLGVEYRTKLDNNAKSVATLEKLLSEYPDSKKKLDAYYNLYIAYTDMGNSSLATKYKNLLTQEFPDSQFARVLNDPSYMAELNDERNSVEKFYSNTYAFFEKEKYETVKSRITESVTLFGMNNPMKAKFALMGAMVRGKESGKDEYLKALQEVVTRNPNTPEETRAKEIMRFLRGDGQAFDPVDIKEVDNIFDFEPDKLHYAAIIVYETTPDMFTNAKIAVSNFNKKYFKTKKLQLQDIYLDKDAKTRLILVRKFKNKDESMDYLSTVQKNIADYIDENESYDVYPVTQRNYRKIVAEKSAAKYRVFFDKYYKDN